ncbi:MAG: beta-ketoacyl synthase chain length factor [Steroidobacteraceae bacterium]
MRHRVYVEGIALWAPLLPGWELAREILRGERTPTANPAPRPAPTLLAPTERRRAPDTVAIALEVATRACELAQRDPASMCSVFASTHGDLAVTDSMCDTLAKTPALVSPIKFHNSVHNAAAGYWTIGVGCEQPYTAVSAWQHTFAAGLLEALTQTVVQQDPVLYVAYDIAARGPLGTMATSTGLLGAALVLAPGPTSASMVQLDWCARPAAAAGPSRASAANGALVAGNAMSDCLPLFEALAQCGPRDLSLLAAPQLELQLELRPA